MHHKPGQAGRVQNSHEGRANGKYGESWLPDCNQVADEGGQRKETDDRLANSNLVINIGNPQTNVEQRHPTEQAGSGESWARGAFTDEF